MVFVNFKTYHQSTGENAVKLALFCEVISEETKIPIIPIVQTVDLWRVTQHVHIPVWIQHVDSLEPGQQTGFTTIEAAVSAGAAGTLLNHSEHVILSEELEQIINRIKNIPEFQTIICAPDLGKIQQVKSLNPSYIAYEPPELIGSQTMSVASEKSEVIQTGVETARPVSLLVGAGIKSKNDVAVSRQKGARGILVSSAVVLAEKPEEKLRELAGGFINS